MVKRWYRTAALLFATLALAAAVVTITNVLKASHDTAKAAVGNIRS